MAVHVSDFLTRFPELVTLVRGAPEDTVSALKDAQNAGKSDLIFIFSEKHLREAKTTRALMWIVHKDLVQQAPEQVTTVLSSPNVQLAMARIAKAFSLSSPTALRYGAPKFTSLHRFPPPRASARIAWSDLAP